VHLKSSLTCTVFPSQKRVRSVCSTLLILIDQTGKVCQKINLISVFLYKAIFETRYLIKKTSVLETGLCYFDVLHKPPKSGKCNVSRMLRTDLIVEKTSSVGMWYKITQVVKTCHLRNFRLPPRCK